MIQKANFADIQPYILLSLDPTPGGTSEGILSIPAEGKTVPYYFRVHGDRNCYIYKLEWNDACEAFFQETKAVHDLIKKSEELQAAIGAHYDKYQSDPITSQAEKIFSQLSPEVRIQLEPQMATQIGAQRMPQDASGSGFLGEQRQPGGNGTANNIAASTPPGGYSY